MHPKIAATSAGWGTALVTVYHDRAQLHAQAGASADTIISNSHTQLALPSVDPGLAEIVDQLVGDDPDESLPAGKGVVRLRRMQRSGAIAMIGGADPVLIRLPSPELPPLLRLELDLGS